MYEASPILRLFDVQKSGRGAKTSLKYPSWNRIKSLIHMEQDFDVKKQNYLRSCKKE